VVFKMTALEALNWATQYLRDHRIEKPRLNAELLLAHAVTVSREGLYIHLRDPLGEEQERVLEELVKRRVSGEPLQYILGHQEFWSIDLNVGPGVLIPRPETEVLVEEALSILSANPFGESPSVLELGTGTGAVSIALAREAGALFLFATDVSSEALIVARRNAREAGVSERIAFVQGDLFSPFRLLDGRGPFDLVLSNPPYVGRSEMAGLAREVKDFEPTVALDGGEDGFVFHHAIVSQSPGYLRRGGWLLLEVGGGQAERVSEMMERNGAFDSVGRVQDLSGIERVVKGRKRIEHKG
jgi:release factor glutamine methyltransferase